MTMDDIPRFDWPAIKAMVKHPAYFARVLESGRASTVDRGLTADELDVKAQAGRLNGTRNPPRKGPSRHQSAKGEE
jgi:hypothetical protein